MIRKITLLFLACLMGVFSTRAQRCGTDELHREMMANDPVYAALYNAKKAWWANYAAGLTSQPGMVGLKVKLSGTDSVYEIPVVIHILDTASTSQGTRYNPTDGRIDSTIDYVNQSFAGIWPAYPAGVSAKVQLKFVRAKRDPNCNATTGILRINMQNALSAADYATYAANGVRSSSSNPGLDHGVVKAVSYWPNTEYYNIWVVNRINGANGTSGFFTAGFATYPGGTPTLDGTIMLATQFKPNAITLVHELGHGFNLAHTFNGDTDPAPNPSIPSTACPANTGQCWIDNDGICDTDPNTTYLAGAGTCPTSSTINPCTGNPYGLHGVQNNFMNYSNCQYKFTPMQSLRMMTAFKNDRGSLITSLGATAPTNMTSATCSPAVTNPNTTNTGPKTILITQGTPGAQDTLMHVSSEGYSGDGNLAYIDNTCKHMVTLVSGVRDSMRVYWASSSGERVKVYIDYNNDGDFTDPGEEISTGGNYTSNHLRFAFTPPVTGVVNCTPLRMRVMSDRFTSPTFTSCSNLAYGQAEDYAVLIKGGGGTTSNVPGAVTLQNPPDGGNPSCFNTSLTFRFTTSSSITPIWYRWFKKNGSITTAKNSGSATDTVWTSSSFNNLDTVWVRVGYLGLCGIDTTVSDSIVVYRVLSVTPAVTIGLTKGTNPGCPDDTLRFSVLSNVNPGGSPTYTWHIGSAVRYTGNTPYFDTFALPDNTPVYVIMQSSASPPCAPAPGTAQSATILYKHGYRKPVAQVALTTGTNPGCSGQTLGFTAITANEGTAPIYQWRVNGVNSGGPTSNPTFSGVFNSGDKISYILTSNSTCVLPADQTVNSDTITVIHTKLIADVQIAVVGGTNIACAGHTVIFSANTTNAGSNPSFQWLLNGSPIANTNSPIYSSSTLVTGDKISCVLIATDPCVDNPLDTSSEISMIINPSAVPSVSIAITGGKNPWCFDSVVTFTATPTNGGPNPNFEWLVNGFPSYNGPVFPNGAYLNGDVVVCRMNPTDDACYWPDTVYSAPDTMIRSTRPEPPIIHLIGNNLTTNKAGSYVWFGPGGMYSTGTNGTYHPTEKGIYYAVTDNNGCWSLPSNFLTITLLDISTAELAPVKVYPNPTDGKIILDWGSTQVNMNIGIYNPVGQLIREESAVNVLRKEIDLNGLANGMYYIVLKDENGNTGTVKITLSR